MSNLKSTLLGLLVAVLGVINTSAWAQSSTDSLTRNLMQQAVTVRDFGRTVPQEKVYLHFDNTSYYQGDKIWFKCYVVTADQNRLSNLSKTLYVELLGPDGVVKDKRSLRIEKGVCNGNFELNQIPFQSGFYEIRAYTKYMTNFGEGTIFSRIFPVFDLPKTDGDYSERRMVRMQNVNVKSQNRRNMVFRNEKLNLKFYPEGGNLVKGIESMVAFEATSAYGTPLDLEGIIQNKQGEMITSLKTNHEGRGVFAYTPQDGDKAVVEYGGQRHTFTLPKALDMGYVLQVDNISSADSIKLTIKKSPDAPDMPLGTTIMSGGKLYNYAIVSCQDGEPAHLSVAKKKFPAGVAQVVLSDASGKVIADRLIFVKSAKRANIKASTKEKEFKPHEAINLKFDVSNDFGQPIKTSMSVAVRDGEECILSTHNIMTDLLLMSEIKGYVHNPSFYFESDDEAHRKALDELLMVQGWRRYNWEWWAGLKPFDLKYIPEQGIEVRGEVLKVGSDEPMTGIQLSSLLTSRGDEEYNAVKAEIKAKAQSGVVASASENPEDNAHMGIIDVDSMGRFEFIGNFNGKWNLVLAVTNDKNNRAKASRIIIDRSHTPKPTDYSPSDMLIRLSDEDQAKADAQAETNRELKRQKRELQDTVGGGLIAFTDPNEAKKDLEDRVHNIKEVVVESDDTPEQEKYVARANSEAYYDVATEMDHIRDLGTTAANISLLLAQIDENFIVSRTQLAGAQFQAQSNSEFEAQGSGAMEAEQGFTNEEREWYIYYKGKEPLFIVDYQRDYGEVPQQELVKLSSVKSLYVSEEVDAITKYANPDKYSHLDALNKYSCVVFIETYPVGQIPIEPKRGMRRTWVDGYTQPDEFYAPDYSQLPKDVDYRRTLYWNPALQTDEKGHAEVEFYNNSRTKRIQISAETVTSDGSLGAILQ